MKYLIIFLPVAYYVLLIIVQEIYYKWETIEVPNVFNTLCFGFGFFIFIGYMVVSMTDEHIDWVLFIAYALLMTIGSISLTKRKEAVNC